MSGSLHGVRFGNLARIPDSGTYTFVNPYSYRHLRRNPGLFRKFDLVMADGAMTVLFFRMLGLKSMVRQSFDFTSLASAVFRDAEGAGKSVHLIGAKPSEILAAAVTISATYPNLRLTTRDGYFQGDEREECIQAICRECPDVLIVGMGTPLQESFVLDVVAKGWRGTAYTCGGFLHQTAGRGVRYYPGWMNRLQLRWLFRMIDEPKLIARYARFYPWFVCAVSLDAVRYWFRRAATRLDLGRKRVAGEN